MIKNSPETRHRRNIPQQNKSHIWQTQSKHHHQWQKNECISSNTRNRTRVLTLLLLLSRFSYVWFRVTHRRQPTRLPRLWDSPGKNTGVGCHCLLQPLATTNPFLASIDLHILVISFKWGDAMCGLLGLFSLTYHSIVKVHPHCSMNQDMYKFCTNMFSILLGIYLDG